MRTGFDAVLRKRLDLPMPAFVRFDTDTVEKMARVPVRRSVGPAPILLRAATTRSTASATASPASRRRSSSGSRRRWPEFPVFGGVCEAHEMLWRIIGSENAMLWMGLYPDAIARFVGAHPRVLAGDLKAQIKAADGLLDGMVIWGDVACKKGMLFSPGLLARALQARRAGAGRRVPHARPAGDLPRLRQCEPHLRGLRRARAWTPTTRWRPRPAWTSSICAAASATASDSAATWTCSFGPTGRSARSRPAVLTKLNAAKGGGFIFQSDHSVPGDVRRRALRLRRGLVRQYGTYPLRLGEYDLPDFYTEELR